MRRVIRLSLLMALLVAIGTLTASLMAQSDETIVTVAINEWQADAFGDETFADFEAANPGVKVVTVILGQDARFFGRPNLEEDGSVEEHVDNHYRYASLADVLPADSYQLDHYATRTGAYLDIGPLLQADSDANLDDFYPAMLQSFQWDGATWGLPISGSMNLVVYDRIAFDNANLPYPDASWTLADYTNASLELAERNDDGQIVRPGIMSFNASGLMRAQLDENLMDDSSFPPMPDFSDPELLDMLRTWQDYQETLRSQQDDDMQRGGNPADWPLSVTGLYLLEGFGPPSDIERDWQAAFLPNDRALLNVNGYAVSAGSAHPQLAYELIQYMTTSPDIIWHSFGEVTARRSLEGVEPDETPFQRPDRPDDVQQLVNEAIEKAIPLSDTAFFNTVVGAIIGPPPQADSEGDTADTSDELETTLQEAEDRIRNQLTAIEEASQQTNMLSVATPVPTPVLSEGEISLDFGYSGFFGGGSQRDVWEEKIREFVAQDAEVGNINLNGQFSGNINDTLAESDCLYFGQNVLSFADSSLILPLDPFLSADPDFNEDDIPGNILNQVRIEGQTYALPLFIQPVVMWYNADLFEDAGVPAPQNDWDVSAFEDALRQLKPTMTGDDAPYRSQSFGSGVHIQMLAMAYGAENLIDYSTEPATYNLTTEANIQALQEVLNLAKEGYMDYQRLATTGGSTFMSGGNIPLYDTIFNPNAWQIRNRNDIEDSRRLISFPRGSGSIPASYNMAVAIISTESDAPDACYRWLSWLSQQPDLLGGVPANRNLTQSNSVVSAIGEDVATFYREYTALLDEPNVVELSNPFGSGGSNFYVSYTNYVSRLLVNRAFDRYVLDDASLADELTAAAQYIEEYKTCAVDVPVPENRGDISQERSMEIAAQFRECAISVDPTISEVLPSPPGSNDDDD